MRFTIPKDATDAEVVAMIRQAAAVQKIALVTKHYPGGEDHDQERHGDWAGPGGGEQPDGEGGGSGQPPQVEGQQRLFDVGPPDEVDESVLYHQTGTEEGVLSGYRQGSDVTPQQQSLRPSSFDQFLGQEQVKKRLGYMVSSAKSSGNVLDHVLMAGPPGLGKTTLARILAKEMGADITVVSGTSLTSGSDINDLLANIKEGDVVFIDEIHRIPQRIQETLYPAMEDFEFDWETEGRTFRAELPKFTLIGATTDPGKLLRPFRDRFGHTEHMEYYPPDELETILGRSAQVMGVELDQEAISTIATRSRGTPRIANRLLSRVQDYATATGSGSITSQVASEALTVFGVDSYGLDSTDRRILTSLRSFGQPVGLNNLAAVLGEDEETIQNAYEPYLLRAGLIARTPRGRVLTDAGQEYLSEVVGIEKRHREARRVFAVRKVRKHAAPIAPGRPISKAADRIAKAGFAPTVTVDHTDTDQNLVFGWANISFTKDGQQVSDLQGHTIDIDDLESAAYDFAVNFRKSGGMHKSGSWGDMVESFVATPEKMKALGIPDGTLPQGWWVGFKIPPTEFAKVKSGKWKMFSIQGKAQLEEITKHADHNQEDHGNWADGSNFGKPPSQRTYKPRSGGRYKAEVDAARSRKERTSIKKTAKGYDIHLDGHYIGYLRRPRPNDLAPSDAERYWDVFDAEGSKISTVRNISSGADKLAMKSETEGRIY